MVKVKDPTDIQDAYNDLGNPATNHGDDDLSDLGQRASAPNTAADYAAQDQRDAAVRNSRTDDLGDAARSGEQTNGTWLDNTKPNDGTKKRSGKVPMSRAEIAKILLRRGGPAGVIIAGLVIAAGMFGAPATLFLNLKENLTINFDQQNVLSERRSQKMLAKRLTGEATKGVCGKVSLACRYTKPSNKQLNDLEKAGIRALDKDGNIISKQKLLNGQRPTYYFYGKIDNNSKDVKKITLTDDNKLHLVSAKDMPKELQTNAALRSTFRRAYNPRWVNWADDVAIKFLEKLGVSKSVNKAITEAADSKAVQQAIAEAADKKADAELGTNKAGAINDMVNAEAKNFTKSALRTVSSKGNEVTMAAAGTCVLAKAPSVYTTVIRNYKIAMMSAMVFSTVLTPTDAIKSGNGTPKMAENIGNFLTSKDSNGKTAMESGGILFGLLGDRAAAKNSKTLKKFIPGNTNNSFLDSAAFFGSSPQVKATCNALTSGEIDVAVAGIRAIEASNPAGWIAAGLSVALYVGAKTGALEAALSPVINGAIDLITKVVDINWILGSITGDFLSGIQGEERGDVTSITIDTAMANAANQAGGLPLTPAQKVAYDNEIASPTKLAWAEEDRLNYSPLDASNPNTFMGSMLTKFLGTYGAAPTLPTLVFGSVSMISKLPSMLSPAAHAGNQESDWTNQCSADGDFSIAMSIVASDPLCVPQYAVPAQYADTDSEEVVSELFDLGQVDAEGEVKAGSELETLTTLCNTSNTYALDQCTFTGDEKEVKLKALSVLYKVDKRIADQMDNDPPVPGGGGDTSGGDIGGTTEDTGPCGEGTINMGIYDNAHDDGKKTSIRVCAVTNLEAPAYKSTPYYSSIKAENPAEQSQAEGKALVNARASGAAYKMIADAKKDDVDLNLGGYFAFRTYEHQSALRAQWCAAGKCSGAAVPGTSNHEMGLAIDFSLPGTNKSAVRNASKQLRWLRANAGKYSFKETVASEDWHWAYRP